MPIWTAIRTGMVKMVTCSGQEMSPISISAKRFSWRRMTGLAVTSIWSTPSFLMFSMLRRPISDRESVVAVTHSGFIPDSSRRST